MTNMLRGVGGLVGRRWYRGRVAAVDGEGV